MKIQINVTDRDIRLNSSEICAIERAARRTRLGTGTYVGNEALGVKGRKIPLVESVQEWILRLDAGQPVEPISFHVEY